MCCNSCGIQITDPSKVFAMSKDGIQSNYVNPGKSNVQNFVNKHSLTQILSVVAKNCGKEDSLSICAKG